MKKLHLIAIVLLSCTLQSSAQYFTLKISGGYAWAGLTNTTAVKGFQPYISNDVTNPNTVTKVLDPAYASIIDFTNSTRYGTFDQQNNFVDSAGSKSIVHDSYGRGANISVSVGYKINPWISVDLGFNYLFGATIRCTQVNDDLIALGRHAEVTQKTWSEGASMMPSVTVYGAKLGWKVVPYVRAGLTLPIVGKIVHEIEVNSPSFLYNDGYHVTSSLRVETESKFSLGFNGAIGVQYSPIPLISVWGEINGGSLNVAAKTSTLTKYEINSTSIQGGQVVTTSADRITGTGKLPSLIDPHNNRNAPLTTYSRVIEFVDELSNSSNTEEFGKVRRGQIAGPAGTVNENANHQEIRQFAPFTNLGFNIGVSINMSKSIFQDPLGKKAKKKV